ncbi:MAG: murein hydrolase activator EnvC family protein [Microthrixaceae bacterium]
MLVALLASASALVVAAPVGAIGDGGAGFVPGAPAGRTRGSGVADVAGARRGPFRPPVSAPVADPFRAPAHRFAPGNRGLEYATGRGAPARSIGPGVVAFAGSVAGRLVVSVVHPGGFRSSLTGLATIGVRVGTVVDASTVLGTTGERLHLGVRRNGEYLDPATLFAAESPRRSVLVPTR